MKKLVIAIILVTAFCAFSIHAYKVRTEDNVDKLEAQISKQGCENAILRFSLKLVPFNVKDEVFLNAVKEKFSSVDELDEILQIINPSLAKKTGEEIRGEAEIIDVSVKEAENN